MSENMPGKDLTSNENKRESFFLTEVLQSVAIAVILAILIKVFLFQPFYIPSGSMEPTLVKGDRIIVNKLTYHISEPKRGDIIVFKYPLNPKRDFIKRVIGLPGETLEIRDSKVFINGRVIEQPYLPAGLKYEKFPSVKIPKDQYFMMGDNRNNSEDSRSWGTLPKKNIIGKAMLIYWPTNRLRIFK